MISTIVSQAMERPDIEAMRAIVPSRVDDLLAGAKESLSNILVYCLGPVHAYLGSQPRAPDFWIGDDGYWVWRSLGRILATWSPGQQIPIVDRLKRLNIVELVEGIGSELDLMLIAPEELFELVDRAVMMQEIELFFETKATNEMLVDTCTFLEHLYTASQSYGSQEELRSEALNLWVRLNQFSYNGPIVI